VGDGVGRSWGGNFNIFLKKKKIQTPHPWEKIIGQNPHPGAGQMSFKS